MRRSVVALCLLLLMAAVGAGQTQEVASSANIESQLSNVSEVMTQSGAELDQIFDKGIRKKIFQGIKQDADFKFSSLSRPSRQALKEQILFGELDPEGLGSPNLAELIDMSDFADSASQETIFNVKLGISIGTMQVPEGGMPSVGVTKSNFTVGDLFSMPRRGDTGTRGLTAAMVWRNEDLRSLSKSVGRFVRVVDGRRPQLIGSGFVAEIEGQPVVLTACHVATEFLQTSPGGLALKNLGGQVFLEFGDALEPAQERFSVSSGLFLSSILGCDAAIVAVEDPHSTLPAPLNLASQDLAPDDYPLLVAIGYPSVETVKDQTAEYFRKLQESHPQTAKFILGGLGTGSRVRNVEGGGYLEMYHLVPTTGGVSGSPLIRLVRDGSLEVVGIHTCCRSDRVMDDLDGELCSRRWGGVEQTGIGIRGVLDLYAQQTARRAAQPKHKLQIASQ